MNSTPTPTKLPMDIDSFTALCKESLPAAYDVARQLSNDGKGKMPLRSSEAVFRHTKKHFLGEAKELFLVLVLDGKHQLLKETMVSMGTVNSSMVHPREVFKVALSTHGCAALIVVHNHPSGDPTPSVNDRSVTARLLDAGRILGVPLLDHVVCGDTEWVSMRDRMAFSTKPYKEGDHADKS